MKDLESQFKGKTKRVSLCSLSEGLQKIEIAGKVLVPDEDTAYVEFYLSHTLPVVNLYRTAILPQVVANSHLSLMNKVFNLAHLMRKYNPVAIPRDRMLGTVIAVEFVDGQGTPILNLNPEGGWLLPAEKAMAYGIRGVAVMHKAAESVMEILQSWFTGQNPQGGEWTVSIENNFYEEDCGYLVRGCQGIEKFVDTTPEFLRNAGWTYAPCLTAPLELLGCANNADDDQREGITSTRVCREFMGQETVMLLGGLDGRIRYRGVGLTPAEGAREDEARVRTMLASKPMVDVQAGLSPLLEAMQKIFGEK